MSRSVKSEIDRRTTDASKLAALEARKVAILEMVAGLMQEAVDLLRNEGFTAPAVVSQPYVGATVIQEASLVQAPAPQIANPCANCGQEAVGTEDLPDGQKKYLCRIHYRQRAAEKQQEATTKQLMGTEGTLFQRPRVAAQQPVKKIVIQADPFLGTNGPPQIAPPTNNILADADD